MSDNGSSISIASGSEEEDFQQSQQEEESQSIEEEQQSQEQSRIDIMQEPIQPKKSNRKITPAFLTKYQKARIIGVRAMQISKNSPLYVQIQDQYDPITIAQKQLVQGKIPFIIRRYLPDSTYQDWPLCQLKSLD